VHGLQPRTLDSRSRRDTDRHLIKKDDRDMEKGRPLLTGRDEKSVEADDQYPFSIESHWRFKFS
jgi:hypothetical protein